MSAREIYEDDEYIAVAAEYLPVITKNTDISDWAICYFVAQTYVDLYAKTTDVAYLDSAYNLIEIYAVAENSVSDAVIKYNVVGAKTLWVFDSVSFERVTQ